jgi:HipA-like protein
VNTSVRAIEHVRQLRGGTQPHLMRCADGKYYAVKFQNNPQRVRVLANDMLATLLAQKLQLPVAPCAVVWVDKGLISAWNLRMEHPNGSEMCRGGNCFGSLFAGDPRSPSCSRLAPPPAIFWGALVFDIWVGNIDKRQMVVGDGVSFIDNGYCFGGTDWRFDDRRIMLGSLLSDRAIYDGVQGIQSFQFWLHALETKIHLGLISDTASRIPPEWYESDTSALARLVREIDDRRLKVRELLFSLRALRPKSFPNWRVAAAFGCAAD